ncbi:hypothetical protein HYV57_04555 [Candidatus Peregrinibacteria bacterium]|nr:hypothetical protein [Candidatus Peregrinibacteria bacterium]
MIEIKLIGKKIVVKKLTQKPHDDLERLVSKIHKNNLHPEADQIKSLDYRQRKIAFIERVSALVLQETLKKIQLLITYKEK